MWKPMLHWLAKRGDYLVSQQSEKLRVCELCGGNGLTCHTSAAGRSAGGRHFRAGQAAGGARSGERAQGGQAGGPAQIGVAQISLGEMFLARSATPQLGVAA